MTNGWIDIKNTDMMLIMGGNPAENHPCGFKWAMEAKRNRNAKLISVDPRFTRTSATADLFLQIRAGSDIAFLGGLNESVRKAVGYEMRLEHGVQSPEQTLALGTGSCALAKRPTRAPPTKKRAKTPGNAGRACSRSDFPPAST